MPNRPPLSLLAVIGAVLGAALAGVVTLGVRGDVHPVHIALISWLVLAYSLSGLIAWRLRPASRLGPLMLLAGATSLAGALSWGGGGGVLHTVGQLLDVLPLVLFVHVFLTYPSGRLHGRTERLIVVSGWVAALGGQLTAMLLGGLLPHGLTVIERPALAMAIYRTELTVVSAVALAGVALLAIRRRTRGRPLRRSLALLVDSFAVGLVMIAVLLLVGVLGGPAFPVVQRISLALLGVAPVAFLAGLLQARLARSSVGDLVVELRHDPADLRSLLAGTLRDPSLKLYYWLPLFGAWADQQGHPVALPADPARITVIDDDGAPMAALIHDPALRDEPALLAAVTAAAAIALRTGRLQAQLRANVEELRGSRARVVQAEQRERQRLERDLHDGAQQRLVALSLNLGMLQTRLGADPEATALLTDARTEIAVSLAELRDLARGLHPAVVSDHGLPVAVESLAARAPVPVRLTVDLPGRFGEAIEVAAYYVVCESLANIGKHARATTASVDIARAGDRLVVEIVDDGVGGADTERGSGLRGLADRVEALGGVLRVWTPHGGGTRVRAELPCG